MATSTARNTASAHSITASGEIAAMWRFARAAGIERDLRALHRPRLAVSAAAAVIDWMLIALASAAVTRWGWIALPFALFVVGNRQRALGNLLHDASHRSFDRSRRRGAILADVLLCWPLWVSMAVYRTDHLAHHRYLGDPVRDPDFIHDARRLGRGWLRLWLDQVLSLRSLRISALSHLGRMPAAELAAVGAWWAIVLAAIAWTAGAAAAAIFLGLWCAARVLVFHPITSFREISDHVGLEPGSLIGFSRNHPFGGALAQVFHPHNNGFHLLHHLLPGLPYHAFPRAHRLLLGWAPYRDAEQCTAYFSGERAATRSWVRRAAAMA